MLPCLSVATTPYTSPTASVPIIPVSTERFDNSSVEASPVPSTDFGSGSVVFTTLPPALILTVVSLVVVFEYDVFVLFTENSLLLFCWVIVVFVV